MNKVVYVDARFKMAVEADKTGLPRKELRASEVQSIHTSEQWAANGFSDCEVDAVKLAKDIATAIAGLNRDGYEVISITPITSGRYNYEARAILEGGGAWGYGYGYSYTEGMIIVARRQKSESLTD